MACGELQANDACTKALLRELTHKVERVKDSPSSREIHVRCLTTLNECFKYVPYGLHHNDFGYDISDPGLSTIQRQRLAFPSNWLTLDKVERAQQAQQLQHGPDQWHCQSVKRKTAARL